VENELTHKEMITKNNFKAFKDLLIVEILEIV